MCRRGFDEARAQYAERALGDAEEKIGLVLEVHVEQRARDARLARDLIHGQRFGADFGRNGFSRIEDLGAALFLLFLTAFGDVAHGAGAYACVDIVSTTGQVYRQLGRTTTYQLASGGRLMR